ncbi:MAG: hypothetical protein FWG39_01645 [Alphaproteobacteria bacterium]|nr:hypothetical protein [Alphaproteobacteria bacterium]
MKKTLIITGAFLAVISAANAQLASRGTPSANQSVKANWDMGACQNTLNLAKNKSSLRNVTGQCRMDTSGRTIQEWSGIDMQNIGQAITDIVDENTINNSGGRFSLSLEIDTKNGGGRATFGFTF